MDGRRIPFVPLLVVVRGAPRFGAQNVRAIPGCFVGAGRAERRTRAEGAA